MKQSKKFREGMKYTCDQIQDMLDWLSWSVDKYNYDGNKTRQLIQNVVDKLRKMSEE